MKIRSSFNYFAKGILTLVVLMAAGCGNDAPATGADVAVIPEADLVLHADLTSMRQSPMYGKLEEIMDSEESPSSVSTDDMKKIAHELKEIVGLEDEDFQAITLSAVLEGVDFEADDYADIADDFNGIIGILVAKQVTLDQLEKAVLKVSEDEEESLTITREAYKNGEIMVVQKEQDATAGPMAISTASGGRVILVGSVPGAKGALDRESTRNITTAASALELDQDDMAQLAMRLSITDQMRAKIRESNNADMAAGPMAGAGKAFEDLQKIMLTIGLADDMDVALQLALGSEEKAQSAKNVIDNNVLGMVRMILGMMSGGQPMTILNTLGTTMNPEGIVQLSFKLSASDIEIMQEISTQTNQAPGNMPR